MITDCLRAEHYHATKGSFKFTHDTWSQITERRKRHHPDLEMVGWYHTHPGWSVFLSGMDLFICNNFFNKPLDVALVIDPVNDDRGWFQWSDGPRPQIRATQGFYLITNKYRQSELKYFSRLYSRGPDMNDPRYSDTSFQTSNPVVNIMDNRRPLIDFAIVSMLTLQFLLLGVIAWKLLTPPVPVTPDQPATTQTTLADAQNQAYRDILRAAVSQKGEDPGLVDQYTTLKTENARMLANLDGQMARAEKYSEERDESEADLRLRTRQLEDLGQELTLAKRQNEELSSKLVGLENPGQENGTGDEGKKGMSNYWWWSIIGGMLAVGGASGYLFGHRKGKLDAYTELGEYDAALPARGGPVDRHGDEKQTSDQITLSLADEERSE